MLTQKPASSGGCWPAAPQYLGITDHRWSSLGGWPDRPSSAQECQRDLGREPRHGHQVEGDRTRLYKDLGFYSIINNYVTILNIFKRPGVARLF